MTDSAVVREVDEGICTVTLNRPEALNAMSFSMIRALIEAIDRADRDDAVRVIVLAAEGRVFCAGTDLSSAGGYGAGREGYKPMEGGRRDSGGELAVRIFDASKPVIAAINGPAIGIGSTMLLPTSWFLPRMVGISRALAWTVTGRKIDAQEALAAGLVHEVVESELLAARVREVAREIATQTSAVSVALTRQLMWCMLDAPHPMHANRIESLALAALVPAADAKEGVAAFKDKRPPNFASRTPRDMPGFVPWWPEQHFDE